MPTFFLSLIYILNYLRRALHELPWLDRLQKVFPGMS